MVKYKIPDPDNLCCCETQAEADALADLWQESAGVRRWIFENGGADTKVSITGESLEVTRQMRRDIVVRFCDGDKMTVSKVDGIEKNEDTYEISKSGRTIYLNADEVRYIGCADDLE